MPPRKKRRQCSQKAQLLFHQPPLEGPKHHCASPRRPVTHTRQVPSKPIDRSTVTSWVLPQFDTTAESWVPAHRKQHRDQARRSCRKSSSSRFPHLAFESPQSACSSETPRVPLIRGHPNPSVKDASRRPLVPMLSPQSCGELSEQPLPSFPCLLIPPDIQTPGSSPATKSTPDQRENRLPSCSLHIRAPSSPEPGPVLVKDTPEEKYGLKVTWRRRQHLLTYLRERGRLSRSQFIVKD
ncbi:RAD9, HUS1, RAD1-interacting nuclear orphan protein 1 isoform X2 [Tupaia chinensis]|uniref:RAD9, HUS1, RAD1-interacting nuclear orphan protein 1 n=1 Tax=Tupaia chinensis TaxID=246437 RepID=L8XYQ5_TUPCH|nr:RAD9, HUS1, RAD1-interacting nuclear orphan protein 1 isoform X2 [Tupaia chinensis]ELV09173.1 hypothetical protein TREES_T100006085 [Tupaia chinensis]